MSTNLMKGKRGLIMGLANDKSIAWGIAKACAEAGAELAFSYQGEALKKRVDPLAAQLGSTAGRRCDVSDEASMDALFADAEGANGASSTSSSMPSGFPTRTNLRGRYVDTCRDNFHMSMDISVYSFTAVCQRAAAMMNDGGSLLTLTYYGAEKVMPHYNVMGVAKAALEASVRYIAEDLGKDGIRVQRDLRRADQDAGGLGHRRFPLHPEVERIQLAAAPQRDHRRCRQIGALSAVRSGVRRDRRGAACRCRLSRRRHEGRRRARYHEG